MIVRAFNSTDLPSIEKWLRRHNLENLKTEPAQIGFIVPGVACAFLLQCENNIGIFDSLISNSLVSSETRHKAMSAIFKAIDAAAAAKGMTRLLGFTKNNDTLMRAQASGFVAQPHVVLTKAI